MKIALVVHTVTSNTVRNILSMEHRIQEAAASGAGLVLFAETAITGLVNNDCPEHDWPLGQPIPGPLVERFGGLARHYGLYVAFGMFERSEHRLYDAAVLLDPAGNIALKYRRISSGWHSPGASPAIYCQGDAVEYAETPVGRVCFLVCGDLFDDDAAGRAIRQKPDWLLVPMARCYEDGIHDSDRWERETREEYTARCAELRTPAFIVNYLAGPALDGGSFGGAMVVSAEGRVLAGLPIGKPGILIADVGGT